MAVALHRLAQDKAWLWLAPRLASGREQVPRVGGNWDQLHVFPGMLNRFEAFSPPQEGLRYCLSVSSHHRHGPGSCPACAHRLTCALAA